jgi:hypothetical protein
MYVCLAYRKFSKGVKPIVAYVDDSVPKYLAEKALEKYAKRFKDSEVTCNVFVLSEPSLDTYVLFKVTPLFAMLKYEPIAVADNEDELKRVADFENVITSAYVILLSDIARTIEMIQS